MSHASATLATHPARITEATPARPLLLVERLDHTADFAVQFTMCWIEATAPTGGIAAQASSSPAVDDDALAGAWI